VGGWLSGRGGGWVGAEARRGGEKWYQEKRDSEIRRGLG